MLDRRKFLQLASLALTAQAIPDSFAQTATTLPPWQPGTLDIHHLAYGRGNSTFVIAPDGTTMLIDAGTTQTAANLSCPQMPNTAQRPGQWIAAYALRHMKSTGRKELDYALITHIHPDHLGDIGPENPPAPIGGYRLTGIMDVDAIVPVRTLIDRACSAYNYPQPLTAPYAENYIRFVRMRQQRGQSTQQIKVGSDTQIHLTQNPTQYPTFGVRNLGANGEVWTGHGTETRKTFPDLSTLKAADYPTENMCSLAIRLSYGKFDYYTGGDLTSDTEESGEAWRDIETPIAQAAGPVEVAVADHHAYFDAVSPGFVRALQPEVFVIPSWYVGHPSIMQLRRMLSTQLYPGARDLYATCVMQANQLVNALYIPKIKSLNGHIVVRVAPGGDHFHVFVTDNTTDTDQIKLAAGPYQCT